MRLFFVEIFGNLIKIFALNGGVFSFFVPLSKISTQLHY